MAKFLSFQMWPALLGLVLLLVVTGAVWAASPEAAPNVTSCTPPTGTTCGGTLVDIFGSGFYAPATVTIGGATATNVVVVDAANITCNTPAGVVSPAVNIVVDMGGGNTGTGIGLYTYVAAVAPTVTSLNPASGFTPGGDIVTVTGTSFTGATAVSFGGTGAVFSVSSDTSIKATSPASAVGAVDVRVTTCAGQSPPNPPGDQFTYNPPIVTSCNPNTGSTCGGTTVTISGSGFQSGVNGTFGGIPVGFSWTPGGHTLGCQTPAHAAGAVDIVVTNPDGSSGTGSGIYTYVAAVAPAITAPLSPNNGPTTGGNIVTITGTGFDGADQVTFDTTNVVPTVSSDISLTATSPPHAVGAVNVTVQTCAGTSAPATFTYNACSPPTVASLNVITGTTCGGTHVTITGTNFTGATAVDFGPGNHAASVVVVSALSITCVSPAHVAGFVDVTVTTPCATSATGTGDGFTYTAPSPVVTSINPTTGSTAGGTSVTITGTSFTGATFVYFGTTSATFNVTDDSHITATSPGGSGTVDVRVTTCVAQSAIVAADQFTYITCSLPGVDSLSPKTGLPAGGTQVTITGKYFTGANSVTFGGTAATSVLVGSDTSITCVSPAGTGTVDVRVRTACGTSAIVTTDQFTYGTLSPPTVTAISPTHGPQAGGTAVTITGTNFVTGLAAFMGGTSYPCTSVTFVNSTSLTAVTPAHPPGTSTVGVKNPDGQQGFSSTPLFTYDVSPAPTVTGVSPSSGPADGGTPVTIMGTNFTAPATVIFDKTAATSVVVASAISITCVSPAHVSGVVDVTVTTPNGTSAVSAADHFTYLPCTLTCDTTVPTSGQTNAAVQFAATATPSSCTGTVTYLWTFGDGSPNSTEQNPKHTYTTPTTPGSPYSWSMTATIGTTICQKYGSISVITPPIISKVKKMTNPFRLKVMGINFHDGPLGCTVKVNGTPVPLTTWKSSILVIAKKGNALKVLLPAGQTVQITLTNNDDGGVSNSYSFFR